MNTVPLIQACECLVLVNYDTRKSTCYTTKLKYDKKNRQHPQEH